MESTGIVTSMVLVMVLLVSILCPQWRIWPPPRGQRANGSIVLVWVLSIWPFVAALVVGISDFAAAPLAIRLLGALSMAVGCVICVWGIATLPWHQTLGYADRLVTWGPYRWTRNPQYLGDLFLVWGFVGVTGSPGVIGIAVPLTAALILFPFAEEPWLAGKFSETYRGYLQRVPRFIGTGRQTDPTVTG